MTAICQLTVFVFLCSGLVSAEEMPPYVAAQWSFDGDGKDAGPNGLNAKIEDADFAHSPWGRCLSLDGERSLVTIADRANVLNLYEAFTYELWVRPKEPTNKRVAPPGERPNPYRYLVGRGTSAALMHRRGSLGTRLRGSDRKTHFEYAGARLRPDVWTHFAVTYDGAVLRYYENGRLIHSRTLSYKLTPSRVPFCIGNTTNRRFPFHGLIDEVRISSRALGPNEFFHLPAVMLQAAGRQALPAPELAEGDLLTLENEHVSLRFWRQDGRLVSLLDKRLRHDFIAGSVTSNSAAWRITFRTDRGTGMEVQPAAAGLWPDRCTIERSAEGQNAVLSWHNIDLGDEADVVDVTITVGLPDSSPLSSWRIAVRNRSRVWGIWDVRCPEVEITQPGAEPEANFMVTPYRLGRCTSDPAQAGNAERADNEIYTGRVLYPQNMHLQFAALYGGRPQREQRDGRGFYWACHDGLGYEKCWHTYANPRKRLVRFQACHVPTDLAEPGADFDLAYPVVLGPFRGDWYDACQIYRAWALKQSWTSRGPLHARPDVPRWFKNACVMLRNQSGGSREPIPDVELPESQHQWLAQNGSSFLRCLDLLPRPAPSVWYVWYQKERHRSAFHGADFFRACCVHCGQRVKPLPGLRELNAGLAAKGGHPTAYVATSIYDFGDDRDRRAAEPWVTRTISGRLVGDEVDPATYRMCYNTDWWQQRIEDICATAVQDAGFKGIYLDTFGRWSTRCYAADAHGHSRGGGRQGTAGMHRLAERVRKRIRAINPDAVMTAEAPIEYFIDVLDGRLFSMSIHRDHCPIFSAVYHDYITFYGRTVAAYPDRPGLLRLKLANQFVMGAQLGRIFIHDQKPLLFEPQYREDLDYLRRLAAHKRAAAEFLNLGKMLRPVTILTSLPTLSAKHWYRNHTVTLPAVVTSSWLAADGRVAVVFTNASEQRLSFAYRLDTKDYGFRPGTRLQIAQLTPDGLGQGRPLPFGTVERQDTLEGRGVAAYVISGT